MNMIIKHLKKLDWIIMLILAVFFTTSLIFIYSSQQTGQYGLTNFVGKQTVYYVIGFVLMFYMSVLDIEQIKKFSWVFYVFCLLSIIALKFAPDNIAPIINGAKRWFTIPGIGSIQPSEFLRVAIILLASYLVLEHQNKHTFNTIRSDLLLVGKLLGITLVPSFLVYTQPDTGMVILYFISIVAIIFLANLQTKLILYLSLIPAVFVSFLLYLYFQLPDVFKNYVLSFLSGHRQQRILGWLDPSTFKDEGYQSMQSLLAIGSGGLKGKGIGQGKVYIPEKHSDFIFATIGEEGGYVIAVLIVFLFFILMYRVIKIGNESNDPFCACVCSGIVAVLTFQTFQNIGMTIGLMPVKGIALPFLSYGGSTLLSNMILIGIVLSIRKKYRR
ncbi:FtsW/RodA/SpoVE family cell cycle protein [Brevibacillus daliensis]|uniref:FtsW/RodA/SpoVE family cell cycle protein n=1 Tax=Brevibacillus daliensis TaxID=2892995 RepID=UPI001E4DF643|nr:FtsW/RodA/SpoVE family cell cycle protein [Brevibacillus daliensis]